MALEAAGPSSEVATLLHQPDETEEAAKCVKRHEFNFYKARQAAQGRELAQSVSEVKNGIDFVKRGLAHLVDTRKTFEEHLLQQVGDLDAALRLETTKREDAQRHLAVRVGEERRAGEEEMQHLVQLIEVPMRSCEEAIARLDGRLDSHELLLRELGVDVRRAQQAEAVAREELVRRLELEHEEERTLRDLLLGRAANAREELRRGREEAEACLHQRLDEQGRLCQEALQRSEGAGALAREGLEALGAEVAALRARAPAEEALAREAAGREALERRLREALGRALPEAQEAAREAAAAGEARLQERLDEQRGLCQEALERSEGAGALAREGLEAVASEVAELHACAQAEGRRAEVLEQASASWQERHARLEEALASSAGDRGALEGRLEEQLGRVLLEAQGAREEVAASEARLQERLDEQRGLCQEALERSEGAGALAREGLEAVASEVAELHACARAEGRRAEALEQASAGWQERHARLEEALACGPGDRGALEGLEERLGRALLEAQGAREEAAAGEARLQERLDEQRGLCQEALERSEGAGALAREGLEAVASEVAELHACARAEGRRAEALEQASAGWQERHARLEEALASGPGDRGALEGLEERLGRALLEAQGAREEAAAGEASRAEALGAVVAGWEGRHGRLEEALAREARGREALEAQLREPLARALAEVRAAREEAAACEERAALELQVERGRSLRHQAACKEAEERWENLLQSVQRMGEERSAGADALGERVSELSLAVAADSGRLMERVRSELQRSEECTAAKVREVSNSLHLHLEEQLKEARRSHENAIHKALEAKQEALAGQPPGPEEEELACRGRAEAGRGVPQEAPAPEELLRGVAQRVEESMAQLLEVRQRSAGSQEDLQAHFEDRWHLYTEASAGRIAELEGRFRAATRELSGLSRGLEAAEAEAAACAASQLRLAEEVRELAGGRAELGRGPAAGGSPEGRRPAAEAPAEPAADAAAEPARPVRPDEGAALALQKAPFSDSEALLRDVHEAAKSDGGPRSRLSRVERTRLLKCLRAILSEGLEGHRQAWAGAIAREAEARAASQCRLAQRLEEVEEHLKHQWSPLSTPAQAAGATPHAERCITRLPVLTDHMQVPAEAAEEPGPQQLRTPRPPTWRGCVAPPAPPMPAPPVPSLPEPRGTTPRSRSG